MPVYNVTDPQTGRTVTLRGDSPPTEAELNDIFSKLTPSAASKEAHKNPGLSGALSISSKPTHNAVTQYMVDGGVGSATFGAIFVTLLGALAAALVYRLVRGSWRSTSDTRQRRWMAIALTVPVSAGVSKLANGALWSNIQDLGMGLVYLLFWVPILAGGAYLLAKYLKNGPRNAPQADVPTPSAVNNNPLTSTPAPSTPAYIPSNTDPYQQAGQEILSGNVDPAIWARSLVEGAGNESAVKAAYVKLRVAQLNAAKGDV